MRWLGEMAGALVVVATGLAATSLGGLGIFVSPIALPLLWWIVRTSRTAVGFFAVTVAAVIAAEAAWFAASTTFGESVLVLLAPVAALVATAALLDGVRRRRWNRP